MLAPNGEFKWVVERHERLQKLKKKFDLSFLYLKTGSKIHIGIGDNQFCNTNCVIYKEDKELNYHHVTRLC